MTDNRPTTQQSCSRRRLLDARLLLLAVVVGSASCATKSFVRSQVGEQDDKVSTIGRTIEESQERLRTAEARIGEMDAKTASTQQAAARAQQEVAALSAELRATREALAAARAQAATAAREQLPIPLPRPTHRYDLKQGLVTTGAAEPLEAIHARLVEALRKAEIGEYATYALTASGFAVVARLECIDELGRPKRGSERWCVQAPASGSLFDVIKSLFFVSPGRYRVIAFIVSDGPIEFGQSTLTPDAADNLVTGAATVFPTSLRGQNATIPTRATALIYEFVRLSYDASAVFAPKSSIGPVEHLAGANLWPARELR